MLRFFWPEANPADAAPRMIDIKSVRFDSDSNAHRTFIADHIRKFTATHDKLVDLDQKVGAAVGVCTLLYFGGLSGYITIAGYASTYYLATQVYHRNELQQEFDQSLKEMGAIYRWCAPHPASEELARVIQPFDQSGMSGNKWHHLFATTKAAVKLTWYGQQFTPASDEVLSPQLK